MVFYSCFCSVKVLMTNQTPGTCRLFPFPDYESMKKIFLNILVLLFFNLTLFAQSGVIGQGDSYTTLSPFKTYELKGTLLLFDSSWAHAKVELPDNKMMKNDSLFFNYNTMSQELLITRDFRNLTTVNKKDFKSVTFFWRDSIYILEHVDQINKQDFFIELVRDDSKYSLYKFILTAYKDVNYHSNGLVKGGNEYATLTNHLIYYILFPGREYKKLNEITKKSVEKAFKSEPESQKVGEWLSHKKSVLGEGDLLDLILFLNG